MKWNCLSESGRLTYTTEEQHRRGFTDAPGRQQATKGMGSCSAYFQLFTGWLVLNLMTFMMAAVPHSAQFLDIEPGLQWKSGNSQSDRLVVSCITFLNETCQT